MKQRKINKTVDSIIMIMMEVFKWNTIDLVNRVCQFLSLLVDETKQY